jgi:hypothetical protein
MTKIPRIARDIKELEKLINEALLDLQNRVTFNKFNFDVEVTAKDNKIKLSSPLDLVCSEV